MENYYGDQLGKAVELEYLGKVNEGKQKAKFIDVIIDKLLNDKGVKLTARELKQRGGEVFAEYEEKAIAIYANTEHRKLRQYFNFDEIIDRQRILGIVEGAQPFSDPTDPDPDFANDLQAKIYEKLGLDAEQVGFYTAVDSCIDGIGIDAYFKISVPGFKQENVYLDLTIDTEESKRQKTSSTHSVILSLYPKQDSSYNRQAEAEYIEKFSDIIIKNLNDKLNNQK